MENNSELNYLVFVLGYDLLHHYLENNVYECDNVYDVCNDIAKKFMDSEEYKDNVRAGVRYYSTYDVLDNWLSKNVLTDKKCGRCGNDLLKSFTEGYDYQCYSCCEDFYKDETFVIDKRDK